MRTITGLSILILSLLIASCRKDDLPVKECDIQKAYTDNAARVTITDGIWGTVSSMEGDCMPMIPPSNSTCRNCPVKRTVKVYQYTLFRDAVPSGNSTVFFDNFNTQLLAQVDTDNSGFFQINILPGKYTIVIVENGKLYANGRDGEGGLNPIVYSGGKQNVNLTMTYKAVF
jgi:hypothetical protein